MVLSSVFTPAGIRDAYRSMYPTRNRVNTPRYRQRKNTMKYIHPGLPGSRVSFKPRYGNYIGGQFVEPVSGTWFTNTTPVTGQVAGEFPRSDYRDIELALDAAHAAAESWGNTSVQARANVLLAIADCIEQNLEVVA